MIAVVFALALFAQDPGPSATAPAPAPAAPAPAAAQVDQDARVVCVLEQPLGSHFTKKTCRTRAQWKKRRERDKVIADRALSIDTTSGN